MQAPPKILHFVWRVLNGALATKDALFKRKCCTSPTCPICGRDAKITEHLLLLCSWVKHCWFGCSLSFLIDKNNVQSIEEWWADLLVGKKGLNEFDKSFLVFLGWEIWKERCEMVFTGRNVNARRVVDKASWAAEEFWKTEKSCLLSGQVGFASRRNKVRFWCPPPLGAIKIDIDGSFSAQKKVGGIGIVCRDNVGAFQGRISRKVIVDSAFLAECLAFKEALGVCHEFQNVDICIKTDCEVLFKPLSLRSVAGYDWKYQTLLLDCFSARVSARYFLFLD